MARNQVTHGVRTHRGTDRTHCAGRADLARDLAVVGRVARAKSQQRLPHLQLEIRARDVDSQRSSVAIACAPNAIATLDRCESTSRARIRSEEHTSELQSLRP